MALVILDRQHAGKPSRLDLGASHDLDGDGVVKVHEFEAMLTPYIGLAAEGRLREMGHRPFFLSDGTYQERWERANRIVASHPDEDAVYVALHLNAGPGSGDGQVYHDYRSTSGEVLAHRVAAALAEMAMELRAVRVIPADPDSWTKRAYACIAGVGRAKALVYEPARIDDPTHATLLERAGLERMGSALAEGIDLWASESTTRTQSSTSRAPSAQP